MAEGFVPIKEILEGKHEGSEVTVRGWVHRTRESGKLVFLVIRDSSGLIQTVVSKDSVPKEEFENAKKTLIESSVKVRGSVVIEARAPGGHELRANSFQVVHFAELFPISKEQNEEFLLDNRHLWLRSQRMTAIMKVRSTVFGAVHDYFRKNGFYEIQSPMFTPTSCEGGSTQFEVKYYDRKAYLAQSWQLYAEAMIFSLEKIYCIAPSFRAEKSKTAKHLTEYWHAEMEIAWGGVDEAIRVAEELISHICRKVVEERSEELASLGRDAKELKALESIRPPFPRITYGQAIEMLEKDGLQISWGKDLRTLEEKSISKHFDRPVFVTNYPKEIMAFYKPKDLRDRERDTALCFDLLCPEMGLEIVGGSERDLSIEEMKKALEQQGENVSAYDWYFDTREIRLRASFRIRLGRGKGPDVAMQTEINQGRDPVPEDY